MAGSWRHMTTDDGKLLDKEGFLQMIENLDDAYEAAAECYGMVLLLADALTIAAATPPPSIARADWVELARQNFTEGVSMGGTGTLREKSE